MPSKSKSQQRLFFMVYAVRKGKISRKDVSKEVLQIVDGNMTNKQIKDFAKTKHDDLPQKVKQQRLIRRIIRQQIQNIKIEKAYERLSKYIGYLINMMLDSKDDAFPVKFIDLEMSLNQLFGVFQDPNKEITRKFQILIQLSDVDTLIKKFYKKKSML